MNRSRSRQTYRVFAPYCGELEVTSNTAPVETVVGLIVDLGGRVEPSKARPRGPRRERSFLEQNGAMPQPANGISHGDAKNTTSDDDDIGHFFHLRTVPAVNAAAPTVSRTIAMQP